MFPGQLATGPFSLRQGEPCCALSISAELSPDGELSAHSVAATRITPTHRMTYDQVDAVIASGELPPDLCALLQVPSLPGSLPSTSSNPSPIAARQAARNSQTCAYRYTAGRLAQPKMFAMALNRSQQQMVCPATNTTISITVAPVYCYKFWKFSAVSAAGGGAGE